MIDVPMENLGFPFSFCGFRIKEWDCPFCGLKNMNGQSVCECGACSRVNVKNGKQTAFIMKGTKCYEEAIP